MIRFLIILFLTFPVLAETVYISQAGSGTGSGADTGNRMSVAGFNTAANWTNTVANDGKIGPSDTVSLSGTMTTALVVQGSGTAGNFITILFETGAKLSASFWTVDGAIQGANKDYIIIDGGNTARVGTRQDPYSTNSSLFQTNIECTANGEALANQQPTRGIVFVTLCNDIIVRNFRTQNLYVKLPYSTNANEFGGAISLAGTGNLMVSNCVIRMGIDGAIVKAEATNVTGLVVADCDIRQVSNGIKPGAASGTCSFTEAQVMRNRIDELGMWSAPPGGSIHHNDGIQLIIGSPGANSLRTVIAYNWLGPDLGTNGHTTSAIFCEDDSQETYIYNNLVTLSPTHWTANALIQGVQTSGYSVGQARPGLIANNTVIGGGSGSGISSYHHAVSNNIVHNVGNIFTRTSGVTGTNDYNVIYGTSGDTDGEFYNGTVIYGRFIGATPNWRDTEFQDANSINQNPLVNSDGTLQAASPARNFGKPMSAVFTDDFNGNARSAWDAGAFEYQSAVILNTPYLRPLRFFVRP